ncbi:MAG: DUF1361 domain-containing protein [Anaerolineae bacterium]
MYHHVDEMLIRAGRRLHAALLRYGGYPMLLATGLSTLLFAGRVYLSRTWVFAFLLWNLFLAWVPYLGSLLAVWLHHRIPRHWGLLLLPGLVTVAFFPNAPYIVTDFLHLVERPPVPLWYDIGLLTSFALTGLYLATYALRILQTVVTAWVGRVLGWGFVVVVVALSGMGIYVGRFLRWNSWDLLTRPRAVFYDLAIRLRYPWRYPGTYGVTLLFAGLLLVFYLAVTLRPEGEPVPVERRR